MNLADGINSFLARFDVAVIRRSTLERLVQEPSADVRDLQLDVLHRELLKHQIAVKWELLDFQVRQCGSSVPAVRTCPLCEQVGPEAEFAGPASHCIFGGGHLQRNRCPGCGLIFGADKMFALTAAELSQDYAWHYKAYAEGDSTPQEVRAFHALQPVRGRRYLNFGAGAWSRSVEQLRAEGWDVWSYEPHAAPSGALFPMISDARQLATMRFDGIFSNNVLEHFRHPVQELSFMATLLKPGGRMAHATPCFEYKYEYTRFHLFFFTGRSRDVLTAKAGLTLVDFVNDGDFMCAVWKSAG